MSVTENPVDCETCPSKLETQLLSIAASLPGVICSFRQTANGRRSFPYASENCFNVYGISPEALQISAEPVFLRLHPDDLQHVQASIEESAKSGRVWRDEFRYDHPTKGLIWLEGQSSPVREPNGDITWHGYVQEITERKQAELKLRISEARFQAFFNSGLIGVISWNADGAITDANDTLLEMIGYSRDDLEAGRINWRHITPPEFEEIDRIALENIIASGSTRPFEKEYFRKDGSRLPVLLAIATLDASHRHGVGFVLDVSERKKDEARLQQANAERFNCMKSMAAGLAHEINQPLAATVIYLKTIKRHLDKTPEQRTISVPETLDKAAAQVTRAGQTIARLRALLRMESRTR
jgi:PAS domain S-box-containing protein